MSEEATEIIDTVVHPYFKDTDDIREFMQAPWSGRRLPGAHRVLYPAPTGIPPYGEYDSHARADAGMPGSDADRTAEHLREDGVTKAVLMPLTRGIHPDLDLGTAVCAATNEWLADTWLSDPTHAEFYYGSIRVNPGDPSAAVEEIERWADHPRMVQVAVPLEAHRPYGQRFYRPIWEAAARRGLPVAVHTDGGAGTDFFPTPNGYPRTFIEYTTLVPANAIYHLSGLINEGVFEQIPGLRFFFADGGHDFAMPLMWRMDENWPTTRVELPWVKREPTAYLAQQVRFATYLLGGPPDPTVAEAWYELTDCARLMMYGGSYPRWSYMPPTQAVTTMDELSRARILTGNAFSWYPKIRGGLTSQGDS